MFFIRAVASVLHSPVRTAVQTVWTGSVQSRPPVFVDWMKTVSPVRGFSRLQSTAKTRILQPDRYLSGTAWDYSYKLTLTYKEKHPKQLSRPQPYDRQVPSICQRPPNLKDGKTTRQEVPSSRTAEISRTIDSHKHPQDHAIRPPVSDGR